MIVQALLLCMAWLIVRDVVDAAAFTDCALRDRAGWPPWCFEGPFSDYWFNLSKARYIGYETFWAVVLLTLTSLPFWTRRRGLALTLMLVLPVVLKSILLMFLSQ